MTLSQLKIWVDTGRELEFEYKGKWYSITYYGDERKKYISFCEFYKELLDVENVEELWNSSYKGMKLDELLSSIPENEIDVA